MRYKRGMRQLIRHLPRLLRLLKGLMRDPRVGWQYKALLMAGVAWLVSPIDPIPDFLPVIGALDDAAVVFLISRYVLRHIPEEILEEHWGGDPATLRSILERKK